jgi:pantoate--beta-alanine ligase
MLMIESPAIIHAPEGLRRACDDARRAGDRVAFVPTMGALHEGHLALVREAKACARYVVVSIFVNPTQFGPTEDFARYPRNLSGDVAKLAPLGVNAVFAPEPTAMYPQGDQTRVRVGSLSEALCGPFRPGHFEGVATIVAKLFALVGACCTVLGRKDYQQLLIIKRMVTDLFLPVEVIGHPIVREGDGLAMSSRNAYLTPEERVRALSLSRALGIAGATFREGERDAKKLEALVVAEVAKAADAIDYVSVVDADTLRPFETPIATRALAAVACRIGNTRLIDNTILEEGRS